MPRYFHKELITNPVFHKGTRVQWEAVEDLNGVLKTEDNDLAEKLASLHKQRVGGVQEIDATKFEELKKNPTLTPFTPSSEHNAGPRLISRDSQKLVKTPVAAPSAQLAGEPAAVAPVGAGNLAADAPDASLSKVVDKPPVVDKPQIRTRKTKGAAAKAAESA